MILMAGRNEALAGRLRALRRGAPHAVMGFTDDVAGVMGLADCFIGKPGPASLSEAVHLGLPVITVRNAWTMPQERYNTEWILDRGVGRVVANWAALPVAVDEVLERLSFFRAAAERVGNRAVFEVPDLIGDLLFDEQSAGRLTCARTSRRSTAFARIRRAEGGRARQATRQVGLGCQRWRFERGLRLRPLDRRRRRLSYCGGDAVDDFEPAVVVLDQRRQALDPVAVVAVQDALDLADLGVVDVAADDAVGTEATRLARDRHLELVDVADRALDLVFQVARQAPVRQAELGPRAVEPAVDLQRELVGDVACVGQPLGAGGSRRRTGLRG